MMARPATAGPNHACSANFGREQRRGSAREHKNFGGLKDKEVLRKRIPNDECQQAKRHGQQQIRSLAAELPERNGKAGAGKRNKQQSRQKRAHWLFRRAIERRCGESYGEEQQRKLRQRKKIAVKREKRI
jgi:hypothetical protein